LANKNFDGAFACPGIGQHWQENELDWPSGEAKKIGKHPNAVQPSGHDQETSRVRFFLDPNIPVVIGEFFSNYHRHLTIK
jgi:hypothetical protein